VKQWPTLGRGPTGVAVLLLMKLVCICDEEFGAGNEIRTRDPDLGKVVLYQLSYSRIESMLLHLLVANSRFDES
jgi:hypothetical protein